MLVAQERPGILHLGHDFIQGGIGEAGGVQLGQQFFSPLPQQRLVRPVNLFPQRAGRGEELRRGVLHGRFVELQEQLVVETLGEAFVEPVQLGLGGRRPGLGGRFAFAPAVRSWPASSRQKSDAMGIAAPGLPSV